MSNDVDAPEYARLFMEGLKEANVSLVTALPESLLKSVYQMCSVDNEIRYIPVTNEGEMPGICAGAYLAGKRALMIMENSGIRQACEPIARFAFQNSMPLVVVMSYRGEFGEQNWWGHNHALTMEPILKALRMPYWFVRKHEEVKPSIQKAFRHADGGNWPVALIFSGDCVEVPDYAKI